MRPTALVGLALAAALVSGCSDDSIPADELSVEEACTEIKEPMLAPRGSDDAGHQKVAELLRSVADRGDQEVREIFGDAAKAIDEYGAIDEDGNPKHDPSTVPQWVDDALDRMVTACGDILDPDPDPDGDSG